MENTDDHEYSARRQWNQSANDAKHNDVKSANRKVNAVGSDAYFSKLDTGRHLYPANFIMEIARTSHSTSRTRFTFIGAGMIH